MLIRENELPGSVYFKGDERGIILFHAYTGTPNDVRMLGRYLNNQGYSVLLPLFRGHGQNIPEPILDAGPGAWHQDMEKAVAYMKQEGCKQLAAFGLSLGGIFATKMVEEYPEIIVGGGFFCSPLLIAQTETNIIPQFLYTARQQLTAIGYTAEELEEEIYRIQQELPEQLNQITAYTEEVHDELKHIKVPMMLVQAGQDKMIPPEDVYEAAKAFKNDCAKVYWYPNSGHIITIGPERKQFQEDVLQFVNQLAWKKERE
ncbi:alpha/beta hydrolase [Vagococcus humatus]|uniref:Carboxylesterase n=1 Tax=Vagococcus humatus TaxID=1889241 RepID=A0A429Z8X1_9ENTE|nr:alpha/beta fold hydrolase [Vagococcus humatus]RST90159.1 carboxylesterase [Vagococcus humatus]